MSKIAAAPVRSFRNPKYPTKLEVQADSELLKKHLPAGWIRFLGTAGAAGVVLANLQGCAPQPPVIMGDIALETVIISLSEEEGLGIIKEELAKSGIPFSQMNVEWSEVQIPNAPKPLNVDLVDPDHKVAVEFVSSNEQFSDLGVESNSTVSLPALAENIKAG
jgi:hypothetical protein